MLLRAQPAAREAPLPRVQGLCPCRGPGRSPALVAAARPRCGMRDCDLDLQGELLAIDVDSGQVTALTSGNAVRSSEASADTRWVALWLRAYVDGGREESLLLVHADGRTQYHPVMVQRSCDAPWCQNRQRLCHT